MALRDRDGRDESPRPHCGAVNANSVTLAAIEQLLASKNRRLEDYFNSGRMREGVREFYTPDVRYLTTDFRLLRGHERIVEFLERIREGFDGLRLEPVETLGDPAGRRTVLQFTNVTMRAIPSGEPTYAHYVASFRPVGDDWLCEMEAPVFGRITDSGDRA
jgi:hypothetical protein